MKNLWREFQDLLSRPLLVAEVVSHNVDGTSTIQFPNGSQLRVRGQGVAIGTFAFVRDGEIRGEAPTVVPDVLDV